MGLLSLQNLSKIQTRDWENQSNKRNNCQIDRKGIGHSNLYQPIEQKKYPEANITDFFKLNEGSESPPQARQEFGDVLGSDEVALTVKDQAQTTVSQDLGKSL